MLKIIFVFFFDNLLRKRKTLRTNSKRQKEYRRKTKTGKKISLRNINRRHTSKSKQEQKTRALWKLWSLLCCQNILLFFLFFPGCCLTYASFVYLRDWQVYLILCTFFSPIKYDEKKGRQLPWDNDRDSKGIFIFVPFEYEITTGSAVTIHFLPVSQLECTPLALANDDDHPILIEALIGAFVL